MQIYSIKDDLTRFGAPFVAPSEAVAKRMTLSAMKDEKTDLYQFAENMSLWYLGEFDDQTGEIKPERKQIFVLSDYKKEE